MAVRRGFRGVTPEVRIAARTLRRSLTGAEGVLWEVLRSGRLYNLKFRQQHAVERFVFDFYCPAFKLVVEVDGSVHDSATAAERDAARTAELNTHGYRVVRGHNDEGLHALPVVIERIRAAVAGTIPPLPRAGEGVRG